MSSCKFCGIPEGMPDWRGDAAHINRDGLCAACNYVLQRVKYQPDKVTHEDQLWFDAMCELNFKRGMFVPVAQRRMLKAAQGWSCKCGGTKEAHRRDSRYTNYCMSCATDIRRTRALPKGPMRKTRCDKKSQG